MSKNTIRLKITFTDRELEYLKIFKTGNKVIDSGCVDTTRDELISNGVLKRSNVEFSYDIMNPNAVIIEPTKFGEALIKHIK